jgi:hypothetical protein
MDVVSVLFRFLSALRACDAPDREIDRKVEALICAQAEIDALLDALRRIEWLFDALDTFRSAALAPFAGADVSADETAVARLLSHYRRFLRLQVAGLTNNDGRSAPCATMLPVEIRRSARVVTEATDRLHEALGRLGEAFQQLEALEERGGSRKAVIDGVRTVDRCCDSVLSAGNLIARSSVAVLAFVHARMSHATSDLLIGARIPTRIQAVT